MLNLTTQANENIMYVAHKIVKKLVKKEKEENEEEKKMKTLSPFPAL